MALVNWYYATFFASILAITSLGLILLYLLFYHEDEFEEEESMTWNKLQSLLIVIMNLSTPVSPIILPTSLHPYNFQALKPQH